MNLNARVRVKQREAGAALSLLGESIAVAEKQKLKSQLVVAYIVRAEAHCLLGEYEEAVASLDKANRENEKRVGEGQEPSIERNKGWILLSLARAHLSNGDLGLARMYLLKGEHLDGVRELKWLGEKAAQLRRDLLARSKDFVISRSG